MNGNEERPAGPTIADLSEKDHDTRGREITWSEASRKDDQEL